MQFLYKGFVYESQTELNEAFFLKSKNIRSNKNHHHHTSTLGRSAIFYYVEDSSEPGFVQPDMKNPVTTDYIQFCPDEEFARKLKAQYMKINKLPQDYPVHVIKRTKEIIG